MSCPTIPLICQSCIQKFQALCSHQNTVTTGGYHFSYGEVWDDISDVCLDCGAELLVSSYQPDLGDLVPEEIHF